MVAIIKTSTSILKTITYNENKVKTGLAELIFAGNYPVDLDKISHKMKIKRFVKRTELNQNAKRNTLHISLNFSSLEYLSREKLISIANVYMIQIGFAQQPYLVYQHFDAAHTHLHLITINIQKQGKRIDLHKILVLKSMPATREIEKRFGLIRALGQAKDHKPDLSQVQGKIQYGEMESKRAIDMLLNFILKRYNYTSLSELNAILGQYNLTADRGTENSKTFLSGGLLYKILTPQKKAIGMPIKASSLDGRPTLKFLESQFKINADKNKSEKTRIKNIITLLLQNHPNISKNIFCKMLQRQAITVIEQKNTLGINEIFYIDQTTKCVFNDKSLGLSYDTATLKNNISVEALADKKQLTRKNYQHTL